MKSRGGLLRLVKASRYTAQGLAAAFRHEAAFRQELVVGVPLILVALLLVPGAMHKLLLVGSVLAVWIVELLNSAIEALADAVSLENRELLGRAKDLGSAAVGLTLLLAVACWAVVGWRVWAQG
jgi:diacylglycerol kinase (ATP)